MIRLEELPHLKSEDTLVSIWRAIMSMKIWDLEPLLDDAIDYEDIGKQAFIKKLSNRFGEHYDCGDVELLLEFDNCNSCNCNKPVCKFIGNRTKKEFALYFEIEDDKIVDIYHCNWYGDQEWFPL